MQKPLNESLLLARVEEVCLNAWPALQEVHYDGWLIRFADGHTRRVNSVNVLRKSALPLDEKIAYCEAHYRRHGLRPYFRILSTAEDDLDDALAARGYEAEDETITSYMDFAQHAPQAPSVPVELDANGPSDEWLEVYAQMHKQQAEERATLKKILRQLTLPGVFGIVRDEEGVVRSIAKGAVHDRIACLNMVATDASVRRRGHSRACLLAILRWAMREENAVGACVQVVASNMPAIPLYEGLGFDRELYRYHYRARA